jgi:hypothetical protein
VCHGHYATLCGDKPGTGKTSQRNDARPTRAPAAADQTQLAASIRRATRDWAAPRAVPNSG